MSVTDTRGVILIAYCLCKIANEELASLMGGGGHVPLLTIVRNLPPLGKCRGGWVKSHHSNKEVRN